MFLIMYLTNDGIELTTRCLGKRCHNIFA